MSQMITFNIDIDKIDWNKVYTSPKTSRRYLDLVFFMKDEPDEFQQIGMIKQSQTKAERESGAPQLPILGNAKRIGAQGPPPAQQAPPPAAAQPYWDGTKWVTPQAPPPQYGPPPAQQAPTYGPPPQQQPVYAPPPQQQAPPYSPPPAQYGPPQQQQTGIPTTYGPVPPNDQLPF